MIKNKKQFKNKFIDLSNKELNGEVTEEVSKELGFAMKKCFGKDWCENNIGISEENNPFHNRKILYIKPDESHFDDIHCSLPEEQAIARMQAKDEFPEYVLENYEEVSIYDIAGMPPRVIIMKPNTKYSLGTFTVKKYTIDDLKTKKIAVHLPTKKSWAEFCNTTGEICLVCYPFLSEEDAKNNCVSYEKELEAFIPIVVKVCEQLGYTIITLDQLEGLEPTAKPKYKDNRVHYRKGFEVFASDLEGLEPTAEEEKQFSDSPVRMIDGKYYFGEQATDDDKMEVTLENDKVIIKYQGKEKVITRDDFDVEAVCAKFNEEIHLMSTKELAEGTRAWAFRMLEEGKKIKHKSWNNENYKIVGEEYEYVYMSGSAIFANGNDLSHPFNWWKDGWEIYKEQEEPNAQLTTINRWKNGKITEVLIEKHGKGEKTKICINIDNFKKIKNFLK